MLTENPSVVADPMIETPATSKPSRKERKAQNSKPSDGESALKRVEALYAADRRLFDEYRRAVKEDSSMTLEAFFGGIIGRVKAIDSALDTLSKHKDYIPSADYGYGGNNAAMVVAHIRGVAVTSAKVKSNAAERGRAAIKASAK